MNNGVISSFLSSKFKTVGTLIGKQPSYFIIIPLFLTFLLISGIQRLYEISDFEKLLTIGDSQTSQEIRIIEKSFPVNSDFDPGRITRKIFGGDIIITTKDEDTIFRENIFRDVLSLDKFIRNITISVQDSRFKYKELCVKTEGKCWKNHILSLVEDISNIKNQKLSIKYPVDINDKNYNFRFYGTTLGGVELIFNKTVISAKALRLNYFIQSNTKFKRILAKEWETSLLQQTSSKYFENINVDVSVSTAMEKEVWILTFRILPLFSFSIVAMLIFSAITCLHIDWIQSKPWIGVIAVTSSTLAIGSAFGLLIYCGLPFSAVISCVPFLVLGVGMDDTFVLFAAWKKTDSKLSIEKRLGDAYSESSISITITSLTNIISFASGCFTPFLCVRIVCIYASVALLFCYLYQITFVGGCFALYGNLEKQQRHSLTFLRVSPSNDTSGCLYNFCHSKEFWTSTIKISQINIWETFGKILTRKQVKIIVGIIYLSYLTIGFWGVTKLKCSLDLSMFIGHDTELDKFRANLRTYFSQYQRRLQIVLNEELNYADPSVQQKIEDFLKVIEETNLVADSTLTESWLRYYLKFLKNERMSIILQNYNTTNTEQFIKILRKVFLRLPVGKRFHQDIVFNENGTSIIASRFLCQTNVTKGEIDFYDRIKDIRNIIKNIPLNSFLFHYQNSFIDSTDIILKVTIQILCSAAVVMTVVCFLFVPNLGSTLVILLSIISVMTCVIGYMSHWNILLEPISMMTLLISAGMSVDYTAHIFYSYRINGGNPNEKVIQSINSVGLAIFQGCISTMVCILPLAYPIAPIFTIQLKILFLVLTFSFMQSIVFLPLLISSFEYLFISTKDSKIKPPEISIELKGNVNPIFLQSENELPR